MADYIHSKATLRCKKQIPKTHKSESREWLMLSMWPSILRATCKRPRTCEGFSSLYGWITFRPSGVVHDMACPLEQTVAATFCARPNVSEKNAKVRARKVPKREDESALCVVCGFVLVCAIHACLHTGIDMLHALWMSGKNNDSGDDYKDMRQQCVNTFRQTNRQTDRDRPTDRQTDRETETNRQRDRDKPTDRQTDRDKPTDRQRDRETETNRHADRPTKTNRQRDRETDRGKPTDRQTDLDIHKHLLIHTKHTNTRTHTHITCNQSMMLRAPTKMSPTDLRVVLARYSAHMLSCHTMQARSGMRVCAWWRFIKDLFFVQNKRQSSFWNAYMCVVVFTKELLCTNKRQSSLQNACICVVTSIMETVLAYCRHNHADDNRKQTNRQKYMILMCIVVCMCLGTYLMIIENRQTDKSTWY